MSRRIRTIKPEILEDEKTAHLSDREWRIFVSMWTLSDDYGNLRGVPGWISAQTLWAFGFIDISTELEHLEELGLIESYDVSGQRYLHITNWSRHQRVDNPGKPQVPRPGGAGGFQDAGMDAGMDSDGQAFTYIARRGDDGPIKIGFSIDPKGRAEALSKQQPERVVILAVLPGRKHEKALHRKFAHLRISGTEWFEPHEDIMGLVAELSTKCPLDVQCPSTPSNARPMPRARAQDLDQDQDQDQDQDLDTEEEGESRGGAAPPGPPAGSSPAPPRPPERPRRRKAAQDPNGGDPNQPRRGGKRDFPQDWAPNDHAKELAAKLRLDLEGQAESFKAYYGARGKRMVDWDLAFYGWLRKSGEMRAERADRRPPGGSRLHPTPQPLNDKPLDIERGKF